MRAAAHSQRQRRSGVRRRRAAGRRVGRGPVSRARASRPSSIETAGHPIVYAESPPVPGKPVALVYGHYDVQPPDPLDEWITPPFEPTVRDGNVYARGATDDKGQMLTHVKSVEAWLEDGRQAAAAGEVSDRRRRRSRQRATSSTFVDEQPRAAGLRLRRHQRHAASSRPGMPAITYGLRGIAYFELRLTGPEAGPALRHVRRRVTNPANALAKMLAALIDDRRPRPGARLLRRRACRSPTASASEFAALAVRRSRVHAAARRRRRLRARRASPRSNAAGPGRRATSTACTSGYQGEGAKTVLPAQASAKFSFRLVPNQDPHEDRGRRCEACSTSCCPPGIRMELIDHHGAPGVVVPLDSPYLQAAAAAIEAGFGTRPVFIREGGSIPIVNTFADVLGVDVLLLGWGQNDDNTHSPNEKFSPRRLPPRHQGQRRTCGKNWPT